MSVLSERFLLSLMYKGSSAIATDLEIGTVLWLGLHHQVCHSSYSTHAKSDVDM